MTTKMTTMTRTSLLSLSLSLSLSVCFLVSVCCALSLSVASLALRVLLSVGVVRSNERQVPGVVRCETSYNLETTRVKRGNFRLAILPCVFSFVTGSTHSPLTASNEPRYLLIEASSSIYSKENFLRIVRGDRDVHAIVARDPLQSIFLELFSRVCTWKLFDDRESYVVTSFVDVIAFPAARCIGTVVVIEHVEGSVGTLTACRNLERLTELVVEDCTGYVHRKSVIDNGLSNDTDSCDDLTNGQKMAPVLGVPPPPPPAPHMGPDGLILPRKPYNPYLTSSNHKDLRRELLFNQKVGKNVLNQKSELQRALEKQREAASRREAERNREENYKDDPRTALQRAIEQRAKHIEMALEQSQPTTEPPSNLLVTARAKLRPRTDSQ
ncbi:uncharacterized protein LOC117156981 isoform X1 [Bombus vancouverensis nearcticus]|uniref:uncharacterized protein LOC117156981 isoform X1 n=1 Tax=Bombus vancouverensis nearcticus TaxID=2705178 RepID=UPI00402B5B17